MYLTSISVAHHHRRSGYASQNALEVDHGVLLRKNYPRLVTPGKFGRLCRAVLDEVVNNPASQAPA